LFQTALGEYLEHVTQADNLNTSAETSRSSMTENSRFLCGAMFGGATSIKEATKLFDVRELQLALQTFFHDLEYPGRGYRHRVNRKNLPKLSNPMVSLLI